MNKKSLIVQFLYSEQIFYRNFTDSLVIVLKDYFSCVRKILSGIFIIAIYCEVFLWIFPDTVQLYFGCR